MHMDMHVHCRCRCTCIDYAYANGMQYRDRDRTRRNVEAGFDLDVEMKSQVLDLGFTPVVLTAACMTALRALRVRSFQGPRSGAWPKGCSASGKAGNALQAPRASGDTLSRPAVQNRATALYANRRAFWEHKHKRPRRADVSNS